MKMNFAPFPSFLPFRAVLAILPMVFVASVSSAATISVNANGDLQTAIDKARPGDTIELERGATYTGHFTLTPKDQAGPPAFITIRTGGPEAVPEGARIGPTNADALAKLKSPDGATVLATSPGAHHWRVVLVEIVAGGVHRDLITLGDGSRAQNDASQIPHDLVIDRVYVHGDPSQPLRRAIALNSASTVITGSYIVDAKEAGADAQGICGWNGPGPFTVTNNYVEGAGENILFGGADPSVPNLVPTDITIVGNHFTKPPAWRGQPWVVKNVLELKNARRARITNNVIEYSWAGGQTGYAVLFTVRNQDGGCKWCEVRDVVFEKNLVRHAGGGVQVLGTDDQHPSGLTQSVMIRNNVFADIDNTHWGGNGYWMLIIGGAKDVTIDHNTIVQEHGSGLVQVEGPPITGFVFTNNIGWHHEYGFMGASHAPGNDTIQTFFPSARITNNVIAGGDPQRLPSGNKTPGAKDVCAEFVSCESGDYRLKPGSPWNTAGIEHTRVGADWKDATTAAPPVSGSRTP